MISRKEEMLNLLRAIKSLGVAKSVGRRPGSRRICLVEANNDAH